MYILFKGWLIRRHLQVNKKTQELIRIVFETYSSHDLACLILFYNYQIKFNR